MDYCNNEESIEGMRTILTDILTYCHNKCLNNEKIVLELSAEARQIFYDFKNWIEVQKLNNNIDGIIQSLNKLDGLALRYAGNYHAYISRKDNSTIITGQTMLLGIECAKCAHMFRRYVYDMNLLQAKLDAITIIDWIKRGNYKIIRSDGIYQNSPVRDRDRVCRAMDLLAENYYISQYIPSYGVRQAVFNPNLFSQHQISI